MVCDMTLWQRVVMTVTRMAAASCCCYWSADPFLSFSPAALSTAASCDLRAEPLLLHVAARCFRFCALACTQTHLIFLVPLFRAFASCVRRTAL